MSPIEAIKNAVELAEGQEELAALIGVKYQSQISSWVTGCRPVPPKHCIRIEELFGGKVSKQELNPNVFG